MDTDSLFQYFQRGFRVTVGAAASLFETLQDPQKRESTFSELQTEWQQRADEWATKGEVTEQEARRTIEDAWQNQTGTPLTNPFEPNAETTVTTTVVPAEDSPNAQLEVQSLTAQIIALRQKLEQLRDGKE